MPQKPHPAPLRLATFLPFRLSVLSNAISQRIAELYDREFGLSIWQWRVMAVTADTPGPRDNLLVHASFTQNYGSG